MHERIIYNLMILKGNISIIRPQKDRDVLLMILNTYSFICLSLTLL